MHIKSACEFSYFYNVCATFMFSLPLAQLLQNQTPSASLLSPKIPHPSHLPVPAVDPSNTPTFHSPAPQPFTARLSITIHPTPHRTSTTSTVPSAPPRPAKLLLILPPSSHIPPCPTSLLHSFFPPLPSPVPGELTTQGEQKHSANINGLI